MSGIDDRIADALADDALAPTPVGELGRRVAARSRRRDGVALVACALVALMGVGSLAVRLPAPTAPVVASGRGGTALGVRGTPAVSQSCAGVGVDVQAAHAGLVFVGAPVDARVAPLPSIDSDAVPANAAARVIWTFDVGQVMKGAAPEQVDVTMEWLDDEGTALTPRDPTGSFEETRDHPGLVFADRLDDSTTLVARVGCEGYTFPASAQAEVPPPPPPLNARVAGPAVAIAAIEPQHGSADRALAALDADGRPIAYGEGAPVRAFAACPGSRRLASIATPAGGGSEVVVWDTATLEPVRTETGPPAVDGGVWLVGCLDADADRIVVVQVGEPTRLAVRSASGDWAVSGDHAGVAAAVVLREPQVALLASSGPGPTTTVVDLATLAATNGGPLDGAGEVVAGAPNLERTEAVFALTTGGGAPGAGGSASRIVTVGGDGRVVSSVDLAEPLAWMGPDQPVVFPAARGAVAVAVTGTPERARGTGIVDVAADGSRADVEPVDLDIDRILSVGAGRVWTRLGSEERGATDTDAAARDATRSPFAVAAVVVLRDEVTIDPSAIERIDPYAALDAAFAAATPPPGAAFRRSPFPVVIGIVTLAGAAAGAVVVIGRRRRRRSDGWTTVSVASE